MSATSNEFAIDQIDKARYGLQSQIYTFGPTSLPTGLTTVFQVQNWNKSSDGAAKACILESLAMTQQAFSNNAGVQAIWTADNVPSDSAQGWADGFRAGLRAYPTRAIAKDNLKLVLSNTTSAPISGFQCNYGVSVVSLNLFQRLLNGWPSNAADQAAISSLQQAANTANPSNPKNISNEIQQLLQSGYRPFSLAQMLTSLFENRRVSNPKNCVPFHLAVGTGATASPTKTINVPNGLVYILRGISLEGSPSMNLVIDRDGDSALINQLNGAAWVQADDLPWEFFVPFNDHIGVTANGSSATYVVRLDIEAYQESDLLLAHLMMGSLTPKVQVGLQ